MAAPHLVECEVEGWLRSDLLWDAGAAAAGFASGVKNPELLNNLKDFALPSPQPDQSADPVEPDQPVRGQVWSQDHHDKDYQEKHLQTQP